MMKEFVSADGPISLCTMHSLTIFDFYIGVFVCNFRTMAQTHINAHCFNTFAIQKKKNEREPMRFVWESNEKQDRHQMFTIQIFCSYSINYKSFKHICSENNVSHFFPELSTAGQYYSVHNERANR